MFALVGVLVIQVLLESLLFDFRGEVKLLVWLGHVGNKKIRACCFGDMSRVCHFVWKNVLDSWGF